MMTSTGGRRLATTHNGARMGLIDAHDVSLSAQGPVMADPCKPDHRGTPPAVGGLTASKPGLDAGSHPNTNTSFECSPQIRHAL